MDGERERGERRVVLKRDHRNGQRRSELQINLEGNMNSLRRSKTFQTLYYIDNIFCLQIQDYESMLHCIIEGYKDVSVTARTGSFP